MATCLLYIVPSHFALVGALPLFFSSAPSFSIFFFSLSGFAFSTLCFVASENERNRRKPSAPKVRQPHLPRLHLRRKIH